MYMCYISGLLSAVKRGRFFVVVLYRMPVFYFRDSHTCQVLRVLFLDRHGKIPGFALVFRDMSYFYQKNPFSTFDGTDISIMVIIGSHLHMFTT